MELRYVLIPLLVVFHGTSASHRFFSESFTRLLYETKAELARSFLKRDLREKGSSKIVNLTHSSLEELTFDNPGQNGRMFRSADDNFMYNGVEVLHLEKNETAGGRYMLNPVDDVRLEEGAVFFKNAEWKNQMFLAVCYQRGYCEIRMSTPSVKDNIKSSMDTGLLPLDVTFFGTDRDLFLIVVRDPVTIYRWTGTYFNEDYHLDTAGARGVAAFQDGDKSIITVAQNLGRSKVYSKVYVRKNDKIELLQLLPTNQALRIVPYDLPRGRDVLHFVFVLNSVPPSTIFWWTGKEFVPWKSLDKVFGPRIVYVGEIQSEIFFFISDKNKIYVYHPTATRFDLMQIITFDQEVVGIDLRLEKDQMPMLVLLTGSAMDPYFKVNLILLKINYVSELGRENKTSGAMLHCLSTLRNELDQRQLQLEKLHKDKLHKAPPTAENLELSSVEESLWEVSKRLKMLRGRLESARNETGAAAAASASGESPRYHVHGNIKIGRMNAVRIDAEVVNGGGVDLGGLLSLTKDQTLRGDVELKTLTADVLTTPTVNGVAVEDLLTRNKKEQRVTGEYTLESVTANDIKFGPAAKLNEISAGHLVTPENSKNLITGRKIIPKLKAKKLQVERINNVSSAEWLAQILPTLKNPNEEEPLNFTELTVEKLWLSNLNGIPWDDFVDSVYLPLNNEAIKGNLKATGTVTAQRVKTRKINGVDMPTKSNVTCRQEKSLPQEQSPVGKGSFLKDVLNELGYGFDDEVRYFTGTQTFDGDLRASRVFLKNPVELSGVSVPNAEDFKKIYWMKNQDQVIPVPVTFTNGISVQNSIKTNAINNRTVSSYVWIDRSNEVHTKIAFENATILGNVTLAEGVVQTPDLKTLNETSEENAAGAKTFPGTLTANNVQFDVLNGVDVTDFMGFINKTREDSGNLEASDLVIFGDLEVRNGARVKRINDADFDAAVSKALTWDDPDLFAKARFGSLSVKNLDVNTINGLNVEDKLPKLSKTQNKDVYVVIEGNLELPELNATKVNGINFNKFINQVFQINETQTIRGEKIFKKMVTVTGDLRGNLNEYSVAELERTALSKSKPQAITGLFTVEELQANDVETENLDGVSADQILYQDAPSLQIINSDLVLENVAVAGDIKAANFMNECNLSKVTGVNLENIGDFETLDVRGDLSWESPRENIRGLSYFLTNAVTKSGDQVITGPVVFENDVVMNDVNGKRHFNDVDFEFISRDAIYQSSGDQEISTLVTFKGDVKANNVQILGNVLIDSINGVDVTDLDIRLVRKSEDVVVRGKKIFRNGFSANRFNAESVNGARVDQIVFYDDLPGGEEIRLPPAIFKKLNVYNDLRALRVNNHSLDKTLDERLSATADQVVKGRIVVEGNVFIEGDGNIGRINDVSLEEAIPADGEVSAKVITGDIEFRDTISIADKLEVDYINGHNITALLEKALMVDDDAVIEGDVVFAEDVTIDGEIRVEDTVNSCDLENVTRADVVDGSDESSRRLRGSLREEMERLGNLTQTVARPVVFMYLRETLKLDLQLPTIHGSVANRYNDSVVFNIYGMNFRGCGLPVECYCPTQTNLKIHSLKPTSVEIEDNSTRFFAFHDAALGVEVTVSTTTVSYSARCKRVEEEIDEEFTSISWRMTETDEVLTYEGRITRGFLSDVKFFRLGESVYIVMAFYFDPRKNDTHNLHAIVYELNVQEGTVQKVDEIPSSGAQVLDVFWTPKGTILVVGNSFDSDRYTDSVNSGIYRFNEFQNKFELLRFVKTHGILSIKSARIKKTSFVFFVQKQTWPLLILKYDKEYDNYYFSQKLDTSLSLVRSNFLSVSVISTTTPGYSGDLFVGIVLSDDSFWLFKYKHIEGFVEESYQEQNNVRILHPFWMGSTQYLLAGSGSDVSKIYSFVEQGRWS